MGAPRLRPGSGPPDDKMLNEALAAVDVAQRTRVITNRWSVRYDRGYLRLRRSLPTGVELMIELPCRGYKTLIAVAAKIDEEVGRYVPRRNTAA